MSHLYGTRNALTYPVESTCVVGPLSLRPTINRRQWFKPNGALTSCQNFLNNNFAHKTLHFAETPQMTQGASEKAENISSKCLRK